MQNLASNESDVVRYAAILRGTESAWQAISYGLSSITIMARVGGVYMNYSLWAVSIYPAWLVLRHFGSSESQASEKDSENISSGQETPVVANTVQVVGK